MEEQPCARHADRMTLVFCSACGQPLCPDCIGCSAVGIKCRDCADATHPARATWKKGRLLRAVAAGLAAGTAVGFAYCFALGVSGLFFLFFVSAGIGYLVGEPLGLAQPVARASQVGTLRLRVPVTPTLRRAVWYTA
jgi:hypothetical protein